MFMLKVENLLKIIRSGIYLALLTPLVYIPQVIFPTVFGKMIYLQIAVELALPFYLYLIVFHKEFRPKFKGLTAIILSFFGVLFLSSLLGLDWLRSFWGYDERMRGLFALLHFLFLYLFIIAAFRRDMDRKKMLLFFISVGILAAIFGIAERLNPALALNGISVKGLVAQRIMSTTGNPIFLAGYMLFVSFLSLYYFLAHKDKSRYAAFGGLVLGVLNVLFTGTRGAFLGLVAGALVYLIFLFFLSGKKYKIIFGAAVIAIIGFLALAPIGNIKVLKVNRFWDFRRLFNISLTDGSVASRVLLWKLSLSAAAEHPILGRGVENFNYAFNKYYDPQFLQNGVSETFADRAHNLFFDWLVMAGVPGLILYLAIWFAAIKKLFKKENFSKANLALLALIAAFSVHSFFAIDDPTQSISMFFFLGFCSLLFWEGKLITNQNTNIRITNKNYFAFLLFCFFAFFSIYFYNMKPLQAGAAYIKFINAENVQDKKQLAEKMLSISMPYADNFRFRFANQTFFDIGKNIDPAYVGWAMDMATGEVGKVLVRHPSDFSYFHTLGNLYLRKGRVSGDAAAFGKAIEFYKKALEFSPKRQTAMFQLATTYILAGRAGDAVDLLKKAVSDDEALGQPHWRLGVALLANEKKQEAYQEFKNSMKIGFFDTIDGELKQAASLCVEFKDYGCVADIYKVLTDRSPIDADLYAQLAAAYALAGKYDLAKDAVKKAVSLDPSLEAEAKVFLKQIGY